MMLKLFLTGLLFLTLPNTVLSGTEKFSGHLGYLTDGLNDFKKKDTKLAFKLWVEELANDNGISAQIHYYETDTEIMHAYKNFDVNHISLNPYFFLKNYDTIKEYSVKYWMIQMREKLYEDVLILVRTDSDINAISDLKNKKIMIRSDDYMGKMILDAEIIRSKHISSKIYIDSFVNIQKFSTAILKTYFGKVDACIVPSHTFDTLKEMNPDVGKKLKVLHTQKNAYIYMIGAFQKQTNAETIRSYKKNVDTLDKSVRGRNILNLFKIKKILEIDLKKLQFLADYYNEYLALKEKYGISDE